MFYSDVLLSKTGPLARVWLASNMERKLAKKDCVSHNLESSIEVMVDTGSAPMALRLSGQLLLGVVRIYNRKARYLLEDCNEALTKIKVAFKPANVDLPDQAQAANPSTLVLPDTLNEHDLLGAIPDPSMLLGASLNLDGADEPIVWGKIGDNSIDSRTSLSIPRALPMEELDLDFGDEPEFARERLADDWDDGGLGNGEISKIHDDDLGLAIGGDDEDGLGGDIDMPDFPPGLDDTLTSARHRHTMSPLSDMRPSQERELARLNETSLYEPPVDGTPTRAANSKVKRRKVIQADSLTEIPGNEIRSLQQDRARILKPSSFLPRDPMLLALLNMQRTGGFISSILGDGRAFGWAPELKDVISVEIVRKTGDLKRKRDNGVVDIYRDEEAGAGIEIPLDDDTITRYGADGSVLIEDLPADAEFQPYQDDDGVAIDDPSEFDRTTIPLIHPADNGPVSQGTKHAVHLLRNHFSGPSGAPLTSPSQRQKSSVLFGDLLPTKTVNRSEATKMFFEVLVLATKDAIKVEQKEGQAGGEIRLRPKRGLWGEWAEIGASGQMEEEDGEVEVAA